MNLWTQIEAMWHVQTTIAVRIFPQNKTDCTTDMMILLLKYEAPGQMPHLRFKNNHSFLCKSFLKCHVSDLFYNTTFCTVGDDTEAPKETGWSWSVLPSAAVRSRYGMLHSDHLNKKIDQKDTVVLTLPCGWQLKNHEVNKLQAVSTKARQLVRLVLRFNFVWMKALTQI